MPSFVNLRKTKLEIFNAEGHNLINVKPTKLILQTVSDIIDSTSLSELDKAYAFDKHARLRKSSTRLYDREFRLFLNNRFSRNPLRKNFVYLATRVRVKNIVKN
jgi:hypothetical protein